ncbi:pseudaminic acid synthase [Paracoccaceae bacterium]|nr:pseudaminic acid synthase [Paracoccaceae bacterium]
MQIAGTKIGIDHPPYVIAEVSANHGGSLEAAIEAINSAAQLGASAVKIQSYTPDTMTIDSDEPDFMVKDGLWAGRSLYELYREAHTPFEWHKQLFDFAKEVGVTLFSTPFDETAVDMLEELGAPAFKVASFEITDLPLLKYIASKNKPMLISTGMASEDEIAEAVSTIRSQSDNSILLFHCVSSYPTPVSSMQLYNLKYLSEKYGVLAGLSDHSMSNIAAITAIGLGAVAIEKHFKGEQFDCGPDSSFSLNSNQFKQLVNDCSDAWKAKGDHNFSRSSVEATNMIFRRSLYFVNDLPPGAIVTSCDVRRIRPGYGLAPKYLDQVIGRSLKCGVKRGTAVKWEQFT